MAFINDVLKAMGQQVQAACTGLPGLRVAVGYDFPPIKTLMANVSGGTTIVAVSDRKMTRNSTRWMPLVTSSTQTSPGVTSALSAPNIPLGGNVTLTLDGAIVPGDAVSVILSGPVINFGAGRFGSTWATVALAPATGGLMALAAIIAQQVNADRYLSTWVNAAAAGEVVTLTSKLSTGLLAVQSFTGNNGTQITEIGRRNSALQIITWARSIEDRQTVGDTIATMAAQMEIFAGLYPAGLTFADGTSGRVSVTNDFHLDDATGSDTYRRDILLSVDYPVTTLDLLYSVLAPIGQYQVVYNDNA